MNHPGIQSVNARLAQHGLTPNSRLARFSIVLGIVLAVWTLVGVRSQLAIYRLAIIVLVGCVLILGVRAFSRLFMWRLRNRLIVTYIFIGVIPLILLATMGIVAGYLFAGQFSTFVVTTDVQSELHRLESANRTLTHAAGAAMPRSREIDPRQLAISNEAFPERQVVAYHHGQAQILMGEPSGQLTPPPAHMHGGVLVVDSGALYLRAINRTHAADGEELVIVSSILLDHAHLESIVSNMGVITLYADPQTLHGTRVSTPTGTTVTAGRMPAKNFGMDVEFSPFATMKALQWKTAQPTDLLLSVRTRPSLLYNRLFRTLGDMTNAILLLLVVIAVIFALIEIVALIIGVRLTRTMTSSVAKLYDATQHINRGEFSHRIRVSSRDQLASLESSFNSMTESLQKLLAEQKEKQRIESELSIAKEVQDLLFPHDAADLDGLELHGICRPARTVSGDYYDFLPVGPNAVGLAVGDISGKGISAALMMATVHAFVRAHTLAEQMPALAAVQGSRAVRILNDDSTCCPSPGTVLALLNQQLYRSTPAQKYATMFLGFYDQRTRVLTYSNAGHLPPLVVCPNGSIHSLDKGGTVVGLFGDMTYPEGRVTLNPGDIVVCYSDGITEPENDFGDFGEERLAQIVQESRDLPLPRISEAILNAVTDWIGGEEQPDDMTIVLARAR